jgi:UDP-N-acetylmuramyl pentapeptide phosphotransferase/UDP-N-acetylglucosamine-1-phosphate transferase
LSVAAVTVLPFLVSLIVCGLMIRLGPKDAPDGGRKTQAAPVPSSGGVGVLAGIAAGLGLLMLIWHEVPAALEAPPLAGVVAFTFYAALLGWADDVLELPAIVKLVALLAGAAVAALIGPQPHALLFGGGPAFVPLILGVLGAAAFVFVMANAVNFMDGANGIAMGTALLILAAIGVMLLPDFLSSLAQPGQATLMALVFVAASSLAGFLVWNLQGKLFAGDAGSLSVGGLIGGASVMYALNGPVLAPLTLCLPVLIDVFMTLAWRAGRGRPLMQAHRDHAYQLLIRSGWSHGKVAGLWWGMTVICAAAVLAGPFAAGAGFYSSPGLALDILVFALLLAAGVGLWTYQRVTLGRALEESGG